MALGVYPAQSLRQFIVDGIITNARNENVQPSTLDLSLSDEAYRMKGVFLPRTHESVRDIISEASIERISLDKPLACQEVYLIRLQEQLSLPSHVYAYANNKSSSGRINLQARLIVNNTPSFDYVPKGYAGEMWLVISPQSFNVKVYPGDTINQMLFKNAETHLNTREYMTLSHEKGIIFTPDGEKIILEENNLWPPDTVTLSINLDLDIIGYVSRPNKEITLDLRKRDHSPTDFFSPIPRSTEDAILLRRGEFYIFSTYEYIRVPEDFAVEMAAYDLFKGEFRTHYAGFFDPGFGYGAAGEVKGTPAVLEILSSDSDFYLKHTQPICSFTYERLTMTPEFLYGSTTAQSNYQQQRGPRLSKHFSKI